MTVQIITNINETKDENGEVKVTINSAITTTEEITDEEIIHAGRILDEVFLLEEKMNNEKRMMKTVEEIHIKNHSGEIDDGLPEDLDDLD